MKRLLSYGKIFCFLLATSMFFSISVRAQNVYNLNANAQATNLRASQYLPQELMKEAKTGRAFTINSALQRAGNLKVSDIINLQLFENNNYKAIVDKTVTDVNGNFTISLKLPEYSLAYGIITTSKTGKSLFTLAIPELGLSYGSRYSLSSTGNYLIEIDKSKVERPPLVNDAIDNSKNKKGNNLASQLKSATAASCSGPNHGENTSAPAQIDLLIVYTPAAASSDYTTTHGGIDNIIATMIALGNTCMSNSLTGITLHLNHSEAVDYVETGDMYVSLSDLENPADGKMDNVHALRKEYNADLVQLISTDNNSGGLGDLLNYYPDGGNYSAAFSVVWVTQVGDDYPCSVHEMGHNMGLGHGYQQTSVTSQGIFPYSQGWRWQGNVQNWYGNYYYATVMSYAGDYYGDGIIPQYTPYFSNPSVSYMGALTGDATYADAARSLREMKHVIAFYSDKLSTLPDAPTNIVVSNPTNNGATFSWKACTNATQYWFCHPNGDGSFNYFTTSNTTFTVDYSDWYSPCNTYEFFIMALNDCGDRVQSATYTFTTKCQTATYTITFDAQGGSVNPSTQTVTSGSAVGALPTPAHTGYTFGGWWTAANGGGTQYTSATVYNTANDITLFAKWTPITYTVAYNGNGNTGGTTASSTHTYDAAKALTTNGFTRVYTVTYDFNGSGASNTTATATYTFKEWNTASAGGETSYTDGQSVTNLTSTDGATINLYAQWNGVSVTLPTPTWTGHTFTGWFSATTGGTMIGAGGAEYIPTAPITLYAQWTENPVTTYTITFDAQGGSVNPSTQTVTSGSAVGALPTPARTGYTFGGWWTTANGGGTQYTSATVYNTANDITLFAKWTPITYTVAYNGNGNTGGTTASSTHTYDAAKALTTNGFTRAYTVTYDFNGSGASNTTATATYTFKEWNTAPAGGETSYTDGQSVMNLTSTDGATINLYAQWNGVSVTLPTPTWTGHTFTGWFSATTGGTMIGAGGADYIPTAPITIYAQWTENPVTTYAIGTLSNPAAGGSTTGGGTYASGTSCTVVAAANDGYTFTNWTENGVEVSVSASYTFTVSADRNLVANFISNNATLVSLTVSEGTLTPAFNSNTTDYTVIVANGVSSIEIGATAGNAAATISGTGTKSLSVGDNTFNIVVTAADGTTTKTYTIVVTRAETDYILTVSPASLSFVAAGGANTFTISSNTSWTITGKPAWITLSANAGSGDITITVTAAQNPDEYQRTATLTVSGSGLSSTVQLTQDGAEVSVITPTGVSLNFTTLSRNAGDPAVALIATVTPANASDQSVTWSTSDASVATVSEDGVVNFVGTGTATITVTTVTGKFTAVCAVTVSSATDPDQELVEEAATVILEATITVPQKDANTQEAVTAWLATFLSDLLSDYNVSTSVTYTSFIPAVAGTADNPDGINGSFTITIIVYTGTVLRASEEITVSGIIEAVKYIGTGIDNAEVPALKAYALKGSLHISGLRPGESFSIHNINGQLLYKGKAKTEREHVAIGSNGVFVVTAGNRSIKVIEKSNQ